jgi:L-seryl-tRNA(Ser) seleniumtransferase
LVASALLQQLDLDYLYDEWQPPARLIDKRDFPGVPRHGIGRPCKVGKEQIAGLLTALARFTREDDAARNRRFGLIAQALIEALPRTAAITARTIADAGHAGMPLVEVAIAPRVGGPNAASIAAALRNGMPSIHVDATNADLGVLVLAPTCLKPEEAALIGAAFARAAAAA